MKNNLKKAVTLAVIGAALALQGAQAQIVPAATFGDLIFGAENLTAGVASGNDLEVDLGSISNFTTTAQLSFPNVSATDLLNVLGSGYATSTVSSWSVVGTNGGTASGASVGGYHKAASFLTFNADPGAVTGNFLAGSTVGLIASTYNGINGNGGGFTAGSNAESGILATSNTTSYSYNEGTSSSQTTYFNFSNNGTTTFGGGNTLNLYAFNTQGDTRTQMGQLGTDTLLGSFSYSSSGGLTFTGADYVVPEPSTYAMMLLGVAALFFWQYKRRQSVNS
jgi:hypothetical protein